MNNMQKQTMNTAPATPLNLVSTGQIQKLLEDNKNLIMAILSCQTNGKLAECVKYQAVLHKNLVYLSAIADAQCPPDSSKPPTNSVPPQGDTRGILQPQPQPLQLGGPVPKMPFQLHALRPDQQNQLLHCQQPQQQMQGGGSNNGSHFMHPQPGAGNPGGGLRGSQSQQLGVFDASFGDGQGNSGFRAVADPGF